MPLGGYTGENYLVNIYSAEVFIWQGGLKRPPEPVYELISRGIRHFSQGA